MNPLALKAAAGATVLALVSGCGAGEEHTSGGQAPVAGAPTVALHFTDDGCAPSPATVPAGPVTFQAANKGANAVTEVEVMKGDRILGEKENLTPGLTAAFGLRLEAGDYVIYCPNAATERARLTVTAGSTPAATNAASEQLSGAVATYRRFVEAQAAALVPATQRFAEAVRSGDIAAAKAAYPIARGHYERIEPVAESFGDLDPAIDARVNDLPQGAAWTGFHRLEKALWADGSTKGLAPVADRLVSDVTRLQSLVRTVDLQGAQVANGAVELLGEVANSKITGEEDRYSHTDLYDFAANVDGVEAAITALAPAMRKVDPALHGTVTAQLAAVKASLASLRQGKGYVAYSEQTVPVAKRREITAQVNALAETLSKVAPALT